MQPSEAAYAEARKAARIHGYNADDLDGVTFVAIWHLGIAAGRAAAAADIRETIIAGSWPPFLGAGAEPRAIDLAEWAARIAEGTQPAPKDHPAAQPDEGTQP